MAAGGNILVGSNKDAILKYVNLILSDDEFAHRMRNAPNPYGRGNSAKSTVDAIEDYYNNGLLDIKAPEDIMSSFTRKMALIEEDITVIDFEDEENALVHMVFDGDRMRFPTDDLNLNGMMITYDKRE